jgi:hypothetical protein
VFKRDVVCTSSEWNSYGSGKGLDFQEAHGLPSVAGLYLAGWIG